jgi:hypothetical protein
MTIVGLWDEWTDKANGEKLKSCTMLITEAKAALTSLIGGKDVRCVQVGSGTPCDGRSRPTNRNRIWRSASSATWMWRLPEGSKVHTPLRPEPNEARQFRRLRLVAGFPIRGLRKRA